MSRSISTKPAEDITNKTVMALQRIIDDLRREVESLKVRVTTLENDLKKEIAAREVSMVALTARVESLEKEMGSHTHYYASSTHSH